MGLNIAAMEPTPISYDLDAGGLKLANSDGIVDLIKLAGSVLTSSHTHPRVQFGAVLALDEIVDGKPRFCEALVEQGLLGVLSQLVNRLASDRVDDCVFNSLQDKILETVTSFLGTVVCCCTVQAPEVVVEGLDIIKDLLMNESSSVVLHTCWTLCKITYLEDDNCTWKMVDLGILDRLVELIETSADRRIIKPVLVILHHFIENMPQAVVSRGCVPALKRLLLDDSLKVDATLVEWLLSMLVVDNEIWRGAVEAAGMVPSLVAFLKTENTIMRGEAVHALRIFTATASEPQIDLLLGEGVLSPLVTILLKRPDDERTLVDAMTALQNILATGVNSNHSRAVWEPLERFDLLDLLRVLAAHRNKRIRHRAARLVDVFAKVCRGG